MTGEDEITDSERRRNFIAWWLPIQIAKLGGVDGSRGLEDMDARNCQDALYGAVREAIEAKVDRLSEASHANLVKLSDAALKLFPGIERHGNVD